MPKEHSTKKKPIRLLLELLAGFHSKRRAMFLLGLLQTLSYCPGKGARANMGGEGYCWPSKMWLCDRMGYDIRDLNRDLRLLIDCELLKEECDDEGNGKLRTYYVPLQFEGPPRPMSADWFLDQPYLMVKLPSDPTDKEDYTTAILNAADQYERQYGVRWKSTRAKASELGMSPMTLYKFRAQVVRS